MHVNNGNIILFYILEDVKKPYKVDISFKIQKNFSYIENNLSEFTKYVLSANVYL